MDVFEDCLSFDYVVQVGLHVLEDQVNVTVVVCFYYIVQFDYVRMLAEFLEKYDFTIGTLFFFGLVRLNC